MENYGSYVDYNQVLGVERNASEEEIKKAYRTKVMNYHPDRHLESEKSTIYKKYN